MVPFHFHFHFIFSLFSFSLFFVYCNSWFPFEGVAGGCGWLDNGAEPFFFFVFFLLCFGIIFSPVQYYNPEIHNRYYSTLHFVHDTLTFSTSLYSPLIIDIVTYSYDHNSFLQ